MNIDFLAPGFLHELGGGITYVSHAKYLIPGADGKTKPQYISKKPQIQADLMLSFLKNHLIQIS
jgi:hypothetical protein